MNRDDASKFQVGDRVYAPFHGYGTVIKVHEHPSVHPVVVKWDNSTTSLVEAVNSFTEDGYLSRWTKTDDTRISIAKESPLIEELGKYRVGDKVYLPFHYGTITAIYGDGRLFPIEVTWDESIHGEKSITIFAADGYSMAGAQDGVPELAVIEGAPKEGEKEMKESTGFKLGDRVYAPYHGYGTVTAILSNTVYPIEVTWDIGCGAGANTSTFTSDGHLSRFIDKDDTTLSVVKEAKGVKDNVEEEMVAESKEFKVGDYVYSPFSGVGEIIKIGANKNLEYPIEVKWCEKKDSATFDYDFFTLDGTFFSDRRNANRDIMHIEDVDYEGKDEGTVERMGDALNKKVEDAVNPAHYKVEGLPEAIDIMKHLMTQEQFEGFLWGNILKYAYRYGRKGDEHDTAGKIKWYANRLKEVCAEEKKEMERE